MTNKMTTTTTRELKDDENPRFLFSCTDSKILLQIARGEIDARELARRELANRGTGKDGLWAGFDRAAQEWKLKK